jgi:hypothetical protein
LSNPAGFFGAADQSAERPSAKPEAGHFPHQPCPELAIARVERRALVYVCNGDGVRAATISEWFLGRARGRSLDLRSRRGARLTVRLTRRGVYAGELRLRGGRRLRVTAGLPRRKAAFFWVRHTDLRHTELFDGFIQLPDGTDRAKKYGLPS